MKIGDKVFVFGTVDEIRKDVVIIRNNGGYFGAIKSDIVCGEFAERKTGRWIDKSDGLIEGACNYCSVCGEQAIDLYDYCPNCGAKMEDDT